MRSVRWKMASSGLVAFGALGWSMMGCSASAEEYLTDKKYEHDGVGGGSTSTSTTGSMTSSSSTGAGPACTGTEDDILSATTITKFVNNDCGVFVRPDAIEGGDGTEEKPYKSVQAAIDGAGEKAVFLCAVAPFAAETLKATKAPLRIYGGFDCSKDWKKWDMAARSKLVGLPDQIALTVAKSVKEVTIWNVQLTAGAATQAGGSSIAAAMDDVAATVKWSDFIAGAGKDGAPGMSYSVPATEGASAPSMMVSAACVVPFGGVPGKTSCEGIATDGGLGGSGGTTGVDSGNGQTGIDGSPAGVAGKGGRGYGQPLALNACIKGSDGAPGGIGDAGEPGSSKSTTLKLGGVSGGNGSDGKPGGNGQGGGGGGGVKAGKYCGPAGNPIDGPGASGGGAGAGGCGGHGGGGGQAGGSSIAILSLGTKLAFTGVSVSTGNGGAGGGGGLAQGGGVAGVGAPGGAPNLGSPPGCKGGDGGNGGNGGNGGGGRGGHSIGIAFAASPSMKVALQFTMAAPGDGGDGADNGIGGPTAACWDFQANASCAK